MTHSSHTHTTDLKPSCGGADALFAPVLVLLPLLAMQPFDSVAAAVAVTTTTIKTKAAAAAAMASVAPWVAAAALTAVSR